ncbi:MAG: hypothetical protein L6R40_005939 [Gallowayella cf. fulva]|nr:MAG: hypothetical protein L6R40_005939 [Xanthomendoza cf. fulva]
MANTPIDSLHSNPPSLRSTRSPSPLPLDSPLRTHPKRHLPPTLSSTYPHGLLSGHSRTPSQQTAFDARKQEIINTMTAEQIEKRYLEVTEKVKGVLEEDERKGREVDEKIESLKKQRDKRQEFMDWEGFRGGDEAWKIMSTSLVAERRKHAQQLKGEGPEGLTKTEKAE